MKFFLVYLDLHSVFSQWSEKVVYNICNFLSQVGYEISQGLYAVAENWNHPFFNLLQRAIDVINFSFWKKWDWSKIWNVTSFWWIVTIMIL